MICFAKKVYQLEGGIIEYARQVKEKNLENKFIGKNIVFDERKAERISNDIIAFTLAMLTSNKQLTFTISV